MKVCLRLLILTSLIILGCKSKFSENEPAPVTLKGLPLRERVLQKEKIDSKISEVEQAIERIKKFVDLFKKIQSPELNNDVYTPVDFLLNLSQEIKKELPSNQQGQSVRYGQIQVPENLLSDSCSRIKTSLVSEAIYDVSGNKQIGDKLIFSFNTCKQIANEYIEILTAEWKDNSLDLHISNENLADLFGFDFIKKSLKNSSCQVLKGSQGVLSTIQCSDIYIKISSSEHAILTRAYYSESEETRFQFLVDLYENSVIKSSITITVFQSGKIEVQTKPVQGLD